MDLNLDNLSDLLEINDEQTVSVLKSLIEKRKNNEDYLYELLCLDYLDWKNENDPRKKSLLGLQGMTLFVLSKAKEIPHSSQTVFSFPEAPINTGAEIHASWRFPKVIYLTDMDLIAAGYHPQTDVSSWKHFNYGIYDADIPSVLTKLEEDRYIAIDGPPAHYKLTAHGLSNVDEVMGEQLLSHFPEFADTLTGIVRFWIAASYRAPSKVQLLTKMLAEIGTGQIRMDQLPAEAKNLRKEIEAAVREDLKKIDQEETQPTEVDDGDDKLQHLADQVRQRVQDISFRNELYIPEVTHYPRNFIITEDELVPDEDLRLTNYYFPNPSIRNGSQIFRTLLSICGSEGIQKIVMGPSEYNLLKSFPWQEKGKQVFVFYSGEFRYQNRTARIMPNEKVLTFIFRDSDEAVKMVTQLIKAGAKVEVFGLACRIWERLKNWTSVGARVRCKVAPHSLSIALTGSVPFGDMRPAELSSRVRTDRVVLAKQLAPALKKTDFGLIVTKKGTPSGIYLQKVKIKTDLSSAYKRLLNLAETDIAGFMPEYVIGEDFELGSEISSFLGSRFVRLIYLHGEWKAQVDDRFLSLRELEAILGGKKAVFISFVDTDINSDLLDVLIGLRSSSADFRIYSLFDTYDIPSEEKKIVLVGSAVSYAEFWALPELRDQIERELRFRMEVRDFAASELSRWGKVPELHDFKYRR